MITYAPETTFSRTVHREASCQTNTKASDKLPLGKQQDGINGRLGNYKSSFEQNSLSLNSSHTASFFNWLAVVYSVTVIPCFYFIN